MLLGEFLDDLPTSFRARLNWLRSLLFHTPNFSFITPDLALGGRTPHASIYGKHGIGCVVYVYEEDRGGMEGLLRSGIECLPVQVTDRSPPEMGQIDGVLGWINARRAAGKKVCVCCRLGKGRSATIVLAYLVDQGMDPQEALTVVKKRWPMVHPNRDQMEAVERYYGRKTRRVQS